MPEIHLPKQIIFGKNQINEFSPDGCEHAIIICDSDIIQNRGFLEKIKIQGTKIISHVSIVVNSNVHELYKHASDTFFEKDVELIIAAGSGSAIDCGMLLSHQSKASFTAIPCCSACAMTDFEHDDYYSYRHSPDTIILDPSIISCIPSATVAYDALACLAFAVDALKEPDNIITKSFAIDGANGILKNIIPACRGNITALERLLYSMYFAVVAHRNAVDPERSELSRVSKFFAAFGYPRSSVCSVIVPEIADCNKAVLKDSLYEIALKSGIANGYDYPEFAVEKLIEQIRKIQALLRVPRSISGFGLNENEYRNKKSSTNVADDLLDLCYYGSFKFVKL